MKIVFVVTNVADESTFRLTPFSSASKGQRAESFDGYRLSKSIIQFKTRKKTQRKERRKKNFLFHDIKKQKHISTSLVASSTNSYLAK